MARFKPKEQLVRMIMTDGPEHCMPEHEGKVFCVIGPFESYADKADLREMLEIMLRGYNLERPTRGV